MDIEFRILLTGDGRCPDDAILWGTDEDGQWSLADALILPAVYTRRELAEKLARLIVRHLEDAGCRSPLT